MHFLKLLLIIIILCASVSVADDNQDSKSIFSTLEQAGRIMAGGVWINPDEEEETTTFIPKKSATNKDCQIAELKIIDVSFGRSVILKHLVKEKTDFANLRVETKRCVEEVDVGLSPQHKAFVEIIEKDTGVIVFTGWIISSYRSFAQPVYGNYFFTLNRCLDKS